MDENFINWLDELKKNFDNFKVDTVIPAAFLTRLRQDYDEGKTSDNVASSINEEFEEWSSGLNDEFQNFPEPIPPSLMERLILYFMRGKNVDTVTEFILQDPEFSDLDLKQAGGYIRKKYKRRKTSKGKRTKGKSRIKCKSRRKLNSRRSRMR